jgi:diacylglycerol kinase (ATP)
MGEIAFLVNPASANGRTERTWPEIVSRAARAGVSGQALVSEGPGHIADLAELACRQGAELLVVVGGDGTVHEAVNGLMRAEPELRAELATIPRGTGRDFARSLRLPTDLDTALQTIAHGTTRAVDVGHASYAAWDGSRGASFFANFAGAGISGAIAARANSTSKALGGRASFLWATTTVFVRWRNVEYEVEIDGDRRNGRMLEVIAALGDSIAGGMRLAPGADFSDGWLDVIVFGDVTKLDFVRTMPKIYRGTYLPHPRADLTRARHVSVEAASAVPITLDGEHPGTTPARFTLVPQALRLRVPAA